MSRFICTKSNWLFFIFETTLFKILVTSLFCLFLTSLCCSWLVNRNWSELYNPHITEVVISTGGLETFLGFHCVGCYAWHSARAQRPQTDPTQTQVNTDIWLLYPLDCPLKLTLSNHSEPAAQLTLYLHTYTLKMFTLVICRTKEKTELFCDHFPVFFQMTKQSQVTTMNKQWEIVGCIIQPRINIKLL